MKQAIILAAGMGKRMGKITENIPKCMIEVSGTPLIIRLLKQLSVYSLQRIILVTGHQADKLEKLIVSEFPDLSIVFLRNERYKETNNIYSLYLAKDYFEEYDSLLFESDIIIEDSILEKLICSEQENVAVIASYQNHMSGTLVQIDSTNTITGFFSSLEISNREEKSYYKTVNIYKFTSSFFTRFYLPFLDAYIKTFGDTDYYEQILSIISLLNKTELKGLDIGRKKWYEIDDIEDLHQANLLFDKSGFQLNKYQKMYGGYWRYPKLKDFCYLIHPYFPPTTFLEEIKQNTISLVKNYPSGSETINRLAGSFYSLSPEYLCIGNGAAELIRTLLCSSIDLGYIGLILPSFEEYRKLIKEEKRIEFYPQNRNFTYNVKDLLNYFDDKPINTLLLVNPDNPSGNFISHRERIDLLEWTKKKGIRLIIDESFIDFVDNTFENSLLESELLTHYKHLIVIKSLSKSYGIPGLRLGILASGNTEFIKHIKNNLPIWNINSFAELFLQLMPQYISLYKKANSLFLIERDRMKKELETISFLKVIPSYSNYFLCEIIKQYTSSKLTALLLEKYNLLIKDCCKKTGISGNYIRIAIKSEEENNELLQAINEISNLR